MNETPAQTLARLQRQEEQQRAEAALNHQSPCVPWRGTGGELGACIYCRKKADEIITAYYADRANGAHANRVT